MHSSKIAVHSSEFCECFGKFLKHSASAKAAIAVSVEYSSLVRKIIRFSRQLDEFGEFSAYSSSHSSNHYTQSALVTSILVKAHRNFNLLTSFEAVKIKFWWVQVCAIIFSSAHNREEKIFSISSLQFPFFFHWRRHEMMVQLIITHRSTRFFMFSVRNESEDRVRSCSLSLNMGVWVCISLTRMAISFHNFVSSVVCRSDCTLAVYESAHSNNGVYCFGRVWPKCLQLQPTAWRQFMSLCVWSLSFHERNEWSWDDLCVHFWSAFRSLGQWSEIIFHQHFCTFQFSISNVWVTVEEFHLFEFKIQRAFFDDACFDGGHKMGRSSSYSTRTNEYHFFIAFSFRVCGITIRRLMCGHGVCAYEWILLKVRENVWCILDLCCLVLPILRVFWWAVLKLVLSWIVADHAASLSDRAV